MKNCPHCRTKINSATGSQVTTQLMQLVKDHGLEFVLEKLTGVCYENANELRSTDPAMSLIWNAASKAVKKASQDQSVQAADLL